MKRFYFLIIIISFSLLSFQSVVGQTGPAGVGNSTGNLSQPENVMWYTPESIQETGGFLSEWLDLSGNENGIVQSNTGFRPEVRNFTGFHYAYFDGGDDRLPIDGSQFVNTPYTVFMVVGRRSNGNNANGGMLMGGSGGANQNLHPHFRTETRIDYNHFNNDYNATITPALPTGNENFGIFTFRLNPSDRSIFQNGGHLLNGQNGNQLTAYNDATLGYRTNGGRTGNIDLLEFIAYRNTLNDAQVLILSNSLGEKYNLPMSGTDLYTGNDASYNKGVAGIGRLTGGPGGVDGAHITAESEGIRLSGGNAFAADEFVMAGHQDGAKGVSTGNLEVGIESRWQRDWYLEKTGNPSETTIGFVFQDGLDAGEFPGNPDEYVLLYRSSIGDNFTILSSTASIEVGERVSFDVSGADLNNGYYTLGTTDNAVSPISGQPSRSWYVFINGDWSDPNTWTLDASTAPIYNNPNSELPSAIDQVYIYSGKEVTADINTIGINFISVEGVLDLANSTGHDFGSINGDGFIKLLGNNPGGGLVENFPAGSTDASIGFGDPANGGTLIVEGAGDITFANELSDGTNRPLRNIRVDKTNAADKVIIAADMKLNGNLDIRNGDVQINDNTNTTPLLIEIRQDVDVSATASMSVGTADAFALDNSYGNYHRSFNTIQVGGNFKNDGSVRFTNQTQPAYNAYTSTGAVSLVFNRAVNTIFNCNGTTDLYNLVIDKGLNQTYELEVNATQRDHFSLFGRINLGNNTSGGNTAHPEQRKALYIANGTLRLTGEVYIPTLNEGGRDYEIGERAALILDSPNVFVQQTANNSTDFTPTPALSYTTPTGVDNGNGDNSFTLFGKVQVNDGYFRVSEADNAVSLLFRSASPGVVEVNGGLFEANQFTYSNTATTNGNFGVIINGGILRVNGGRVLRGGAGDQATFHLPFEGNVFTMTGGVLEVLEALPVGGLLINSLPSNINVTGGTVRLQTNDDNRFRINSTAPFFNLELTNTTNSTDANAAFFVEEIDDGTTVFPAKDLKVLNDLTIETGTLRGTTGSILDMVDESNARAADLYVGGSFIIEENARYISLEGGITNTLYFNQTIGTDQVETFENRIDARLDMGGLVLDRTSGNEVRMSSNRNARNVSFQIEGPLEVLSGTLDQTNFTVRPRASVLVADRLGTYIEGTTPTDGAQFRLSIDDIRILEGAILGNIQWSTGTKPVVVEGNALIERLEYTFGNIYIGGFNLKINEIYNYAVANSTDNTRTETFIENPVTSSFLRAVDQGRFNVSGVGSQQAMIITDGKASDGGLSIKVTRNTNVGTAGANENYDNLNQLTYPLAISLNGIPNIDDVFFRPAQVKISDYVDDGYITIRPVSGELQTTDLGGGELLQHYWRVTHSDFTTLPKVAYRFYYRNQIGIAGVDLPSGFTAGDDLTTFVPGKVLDGGDYQRSYESNASGEEDFGGVFAGPVDANTRAIIFNGFNNGTTNDDLFDFDATDGPGFTLENANYTAGVAARFVGSPEVYYSRQGGRWHVPTTWSNDPINQHEGAAAADYPQIGDVVFIAGNTANANHSITISEDNADPNDIEVEEVTFRGGGSPRLTIQTNGNLNSVDLGTVKGEVETSSTIVREIRPTNTYTLSADIGDWSSFNANEFQYKMHDTGGVLTIPEEFDDFPILTISGNNSGAGSGNPIYDMILGHSINVRGDLLFRSRVDFEFEDGATETVTVLGDVNIGSNNDAIVRFPQTGSWTLDVAGDLGFLVNTDATWGEQAELIINNNATVEHRIKVGGDLVINERGDAVDSDRPLIDLYANAGGGGVVLELTGSNDAVTNITNTGGGALLVPDLYKVVMNKETSGASFSFDHNANFLLPSNISAQPIEIVNGLLLLNNSGLDVTLTDEARGNFNLPNLSNPEASSGSGGLEIAGGTVRIEGDDTGILLDGLLRISGGTLDMASGVGNGNNFIQYGTSGNARIELSGGTLNVGSQLRRSLTSTEGVLQYSQTGGDATFGINVVPNATRGVFEVLNPGSEFELTGGTFSLVQDNTSGSVASLRLTPNTSNIGAGQVINIGNGTTPAGVNDFGIQSSIALENVTITDEGNPTVKIYSLPLEVNQLIIGNAGSAIFDANGLNLTINESLTNNGTFTTSGNSFNEQTTFFPSSSLTTIDGTGTTSFFKFDKNGMGELSVQKEVTVENQTLIRNGILNTGDIAFFAEGDVVNDATHSSTLNTDAAQVVGFVFNGNQKQLLSRSSTGTSTFGILRISNGSGVEIGGVEENFEITEKLTLAGGKFEVGGNLLVFPVDAYIENGSGGRGITDFNVNNMIQTNSAIRDFGIRKFYNTASDGLSTFTYPVGLQAYTPVEFNRTGNNINGSITVRPVADRAPIAEDSENDGVICSDGVEIVDADNVLRYHWIVGAENITNLEGDFKMYYVDVDAGFTTPYTEANYGAARLWNSQNSWDKNTLVSSVDETNNAINFDFTNNDDATISGIYTAGVIQDGGSPLCGAIPDQVPQFETISSGQNVYDIAGSYNGGIAPPPSTAVDIIVRSGFTLQLNQNSIRTRKITIEDGATLEILSNVRNTNLGFIEGQGTLKLTVNDADPLSFPAGDYSEFFPTASCNAGGGLEFAGNGNYNFPSDIPVLRNVIFSGSGTRNFPNNNSLIVCEDLEISGTVSLVVPDGNNSTRVLGNIIKSDASAFTNGGGASRITLSGSSQQEINGDFTGSNALNELRVNNANGLTIINNASAGITANGDVEVDAALILSNGIIQTNTENSLKLLNGATVSVGSINAHINGPLIRNLSSGGSSDAVFPVGDGGRFGRFALFNTTSLDNWTVSFFDASPLDNGNITTLDDAIPGDNSVISQNQYWEATSDNNNDANVRLYWDALSNVADGAATEEVSLDQLRVASFKTGDLQWGDLGGGTNASGTASGGTLISASKATFSTTYFTFGAGDAANNSLPVELTFFTAENKTNKVELKWQTASEKNNDFFEVQRSFDGKQFDVLGIVEGAGDATEVIDYQFNDYSPLAGDSYYRLRQVDFDGAFEYSEVVRVNRKQASDLIAVPNPTGSQNVRLRLSGFNAEQKVQVVIFDLQGKRHYDAIHDPADFNEALPINKELNSGIYIVDVKQGNINKKVRLMVR